MKIARLVLAGTAALSVPLLAANAMVTGPDQMSETQHASHGSDPSPSLVEQVRSATQIYRDIRQATTTGGYGQFLGCFSGPQEGAMGVHFVNSTLVRDGELDPDHPEALIYEFRNGFARLVGVEFIVDAKQWHVDKHNPEPPVLGGQSLQYNGSPNRFGLDPFYE